MSSKDSNNEQVKEGVGAKLASVAFLAPTAVAGVAIAAAVGNYVPVAYVAPAVAEQVQASVAAAELKEVDTSEVEKESAEGLATETDFGIDLSNVKDGTYTGSGTGFSGTITVQVTIQGGKITAIEILSSGDDESYFGQVRGLVDTVIAQQSLDVDTVSGATYSSRGLLAAIKNALLQATGQEPEALNEALGASLTSAKTMAAVESAVDAPNGFADGSYEGSAEGYNGPVTVRVTVASGKIASIDLVSHEDDAQFLWAWAQIPGDIVSAQSTNVDTVSGATYSSKGIIAAVQQALKKAAAAAGNKTDADADTAGADGKKDDAAGSQDGFDADSGGGSGGGETADGGAGDNGASDGGSGSDTEAAHYEDGAYTGFALCSDGDEGNFEPYYVAVTIEVKEGKVAGIKSILGTNVTTDASLPEVLDPFNADNQTYLDYAVKGRTVKKVWYEGVEAQLLAGKTPSKIDVVSRSTYSSRAIAKAYQAALSLSEEAYKKAHPEDEKKDESETTGGSSSTGDAGGSGDAAGGSGAAGDGSAASGDGDGAGSGAGAGAGGGLDDGAGTGSASGSGSSAADSEAADGSDADAPDVASGALAEDAAVAASDAAASSLAAESEAANE
ncbi:FMN-binding protein [Paratractidigestivibacter sp.]|uniref:FMN-binding protein n=1 Tax=Paratractidigestivibacter sp. TaxID=2847316 RepID=UPI002AC98C4F|nr:FMN-binding protein [Paratractidigestivibacter sp.]